jgi:hypothetical protein
MGLPSLQYWFRPSVITHSPPRHITCRATSTEASCSCKCASKSAHSWLWRALLQHSVSSAPERSAVACSQCPESCGGFQLCAAAAARAEGRHERGKLPCLCRPGRCHNPQSVSSEAFLGSPNCTAQDRPPCPPDCQAVPGGLSCCAARLPYCIFLGMLVCGTHPGPGSPVHRKHVQTCAHALHRRSQRGSRYRQHTHPYQRATSADFRLDSY